jgi:hypothetical protein
MASKRENALYPIVEKWVKRHFLCFRTGVNTGGLYSRVDVVGVRDVGGDLSGEVQTIAVEVKKEGSAFATACGQTLAYNIYANRVYLAVSRKEVFSMEERDIVSHLGIGLIHIREGKCIEIQSSPFYMPIPKLNLLLLDQLGLGKCQICESFFETGAIKREYSRVARENVQAAIDKGKGLVFWNDELAARKDRLGVRRTSDGTTYERRFICPDCVTKPLAIQEKRLESWFSAYGRGD